MLYEWVVAAVVPLQLREEARRVALAAAERLGIGWLAGAIRLRWFRRLAEAEGDRELAHAFSLRWDDCLGFQPADDPTCICVRYDASTDAVLVTVAHEVYHTAERLWRVQRADPAAGEREADAFARLLFRHLYRRPPVL